MALPNSGHAIAFAMTGSTPPAAIANTMVRVYAGNATGLGRGSGTVIDMVHDPVGTAGWLCVLTADHVVAPSIEPGGYTIVGFENELGMGALYDSRVVTLHLERGPMFDSTHRVDLAILGVRIADMSTLPTMTMPFIGSPRIGSHTSYVAGYGSTATLNGPLRRYEVLTGSYGVFHNAFAVWADQPVHEIGSYKYESIRYETHFGPTDPTIPATDGTAHTLRGDSGGPSWTEEAFTWTLNGVHSSSHMTTLPDGSFVVTEGESWNDVRVASYKDWIDTSCLAVVPEPSSFLALGLGVAALTRRKHRARSK
ncbi:MAG: PEP-CTERM sorting domain-containing protein [Fimbriimonadaceae bacterium]|nr:PEP-CTERM sorting domain-containing protein [Fimbriimonadaceae bacterium]